jgi:uncharacterized protein (TIGR02300 family)|tara:strand:- start:63 stop:554 length:492 start_codon:yes stop_codon:yes gene_type:complete
MMIKASWGTKRFCFACSRKFFDLNRKKIECPYCGSPFSEEEALKNMLPKRGPKKGRKAIIQDSTDQGEQQLAGVPDGDEVEVAEDSKVIESEVESTDNEEGLGSSADSAEEVLDQADTENTEKIEGDINKDDKSIDLEDFETDEGEVTEVIDVGDQGKDSEDQ